MLVSSLQPLQDILWLPFGAAFSMSWVLGFLAFLVPSGFGVREGAISILLTPLLPAPLPVLVALLARLWWTLADLFSVTIALLLGRLRDAKAITDRK